MKRVNSAFKICNLCAHWLYLRIQTHTLKKGLFILLLVGLHCILQAQPTPQYSFTHYGTNSGLSTNEVNNIIQDDEGYIWMATTSGLQRFDGIRYRSFRNIKGDSTSIPDDYIHHIYQDSRKNLWVLTGGGKIGIFNTKTFRFRPATISQATEQVIRGDRKLFEDEQGHLMLLIMSFELLTYDPVANEFSQKNNIIPKREGMVVTDIQQQPGTLKYVMGTHTGMVIYDHAIKQFNFTGHNPSKDPLIEKLGHIPVGINFFFDRNNRVWFNSWKDGIPRIYCFDYTKKRAVLDGYSVYPLINAYHETKGFMQQRNGTVWLYGLGLFAEYQDKENNFRLIFNGYLNEQSISYERVNTLFEDKEHNVWVATNNNAIYRFNPDAQFFMNIRHLSPNTGKPGDGSVMSFTETRDRKLLVGAWGDGMFAHNQQLDGVPLQYKGLKDKGHNPFAWGMYNSGDSNTIWIASQPGIYALDQRNRKCTYYNPEIMKSRTVRQVLEDRHGNLWLGTQSLGVFKWRNVRDGQRNIDSLVQLTNIPGVQILKMAEDSQGRIWLATNGRGVYVLDPVTDKVLLHFNSKAEQNQRIVSDVAAAVFRYDDTTMVIAATNVYIFNCKKNTLTMVPFPETIAGGIAAIERDKDGYLWISLSHGIVRLNIQKKIYIHFDRIDGIMNDRFIVASSLKLRDGRIVFGASNQFVIFDPARIQINQSTPDIAITDFRLMNNSLRVDSLQKLEQIELSAKDNSLVIDFSGLNYINTYIIKYKLEGLDKDWRIADKTSQAIYSYLPPGKYTFLVRSEDAEGNAGKKITRLVIRVNPPFWRTWWFYALLVLMGACVLYFVDRQRISQLKDMQKVRSEIATKLHQDVTTTLSNINLLGEMAKIKADRDIERSKEYIDQISTKSHNMIIAMDDILWSIDPQNDGMEKTLLRMLEFIDALKNRHGSLIELELDKKITSLRMDMKTRHEFFLIFKEGLRMIVQYAGGRNTLINIDLFRNRLSMKLQDATARLDMHIPEIEQIIKEINTRAETMKAESDIQYDKNGIAIILMIPVK